MIGLLTHDDHASVLTGFLSPIDAAQLRATCSAALEALTYTDWAMALWRRWRAEAGVNVSTPPSLEGATEYQRFTVLAGTAAMRAHRAAMLRVALLARGLSLRRDSWLCSSFIEGRPFAGSLHAVVEGVAEMNFYFTRTQYAVCRELVSQERWEDAMAMAADAGGPLSDFHLRLDSAALSAAAKERALQWYLERNRAHGAFGSAVAASSPPDELPEKVRQQVLALRSSVGTQPARKRYHELDDEGRRRLREETRRAVVEVDEREMSALAEHVAAVRRLAERPALEELHLPARLSHRQRAQLHDLAESLGLAHESRGTGSERHLVVWRWHAGSDDEADEHEDSDDDSDDDDDDGGGNDDDG